MPGASSCRWKRSSARPRLAVVALLGFLDPVEVRVEVVLLRPRGAVDPLQHLVLRVAAPVRAGELHQLEHLELAGRRHVRSAAEVRELALGVERDVLVGRNRRDDLGLEVLADRLEVRDRVVARHRAPRHGLVLFRELGHLRLDRGEILRRERALVREVVVEAVLDDGADRHLRVGKELLDRVGEQVRRRMADHLEAVRILVGDDRDIGVGRHDERRVDELAVDAAGQRGLGEAGADRRGDRRRRRRAPDTISTAPSGRRMFGMADSRNEKSADEPHFSVNRRRANSRWL